MSAVTKEQATEQCTGREQKIYANRFSSKQEESKQNMWATLCQDFFQKFISKDSVVVDLGAGDGLFIKNIEAKKKIAVDINPEVSNLEQFGVEVVNSLATEFADKLSEPADVVFMSNFLEHLPQKSLVLEVLEECSKALKPGGKVIILQPNARYVGAAYWDYIDHHIALTENSLTEALEVSNFTVEKLIPRFLPYTVKSVLGNFTNLIGLYLKIPIAWRIFGQQTFVVARNESKVG